MAKDDIVFAFPQVARGPYWSRAGLRLRCIGYSKSVPRYSPLDKFQIIPRQSRPLSVLGHCTSSSLHWSFPTCVSRGCLSGFIIDSHGKFCTWSKAYGALSCWFELVRATCKFLNTQCVGIFAFRRRVNASRSHAKIRLNNWSEKYVNPKGNNQLDEICPHHSRLDNLIKTKGASHLRP